MKTMKIEHDLSKHHRLLSDAFPHLSPEEAWEKYKLSNEQVSFFNTNGYLAGVKVLEDNQVEKLLLDLEEIRDPSHPRNHLFYEFHTNESKDLNAVLFHSLGHWRITI